MALRLEGKSPLAAYKITHPKSSNEAAQVESSRWKNDPKVALRFHWLQKQTEKTTLLGVEEKRGKLAEIVRDPAQVFQPEIRDIIKAIEVDNVMAGHNKPTELAVSGTLEITAEALILRLTNGPKRANK